MEGKSLRSRGLGFLLAFEVIMELGQAFFSDLYGMVTEHSFQG